MIKAPLLSHPIHHQHPFPFFTVSEAFTREQCARLEQLFVGEEAWRPQEGEFYRCSFLDATGAMPRKFLSDMHARMRVLTGLPLMDHVEVTAQRMLPGQTIGVHSDRPLLGFELVRVVIQLNRHWQKEHGGVLHLYERLDGPACLNIHPTYNSAVGFVLHPNSYHAVTQVSHPRHTLVFNFWHEANTEALAAHLKALFANLNFSEFPEALNGIATAAEAQLAEEITLRAGTAALALSRWGYDTDTIVRGYQVSAGLCSHDGLSGEARSAIRLAEWVANLYQESFDLARWTCLQNDLRGHLRYARLAPTLALCFPTLA
jgi:2OG-Fe(II) oxygenase superfamily